MATVGFKGSDGVFFYRGDWRVLWCVCEGLMILWWGLRRRTLVTDGTRQYSLFMPPTLFRLMTFIRCYIIGNLHHQISPRSPLVMNTCQHLLQCIVVIMLLFIILYTVFFSCNFFVVDHFAIVKFNLVFSPVYWFSNRCLRPIFFTNSTQWRSQLSRFVISFCSAQIILWLMPQLLSYLKSTSLSLQLSDGNHVSCQLLYAVLLVCLCSTSLWTALSERP